MKASLREDMNFLYTPNPLRTKVLLDDHDKEVLRLKIRIEELEERMGSAYFDLHPEHREWYSNTIAPITLDESVARAMRELHLETNPVDGRVNDLFGYYIEALSDIHDGDCTCFPCSCVKCAAESVLGIDTCPGLGKHEGHYVHIAFKSTKTPDAPDRTIDEALEYLNTPSQTKKWDNYTDAQWEALTTRWTGERERAHAWLANYRATHELVRPVRGP